MFTGIITGVGLITDVRALGQGPGHGVQLSIQAPPGYLDDVGVGDSIAINGACMTVTTLDAASSGFSVDVSAESLARTAGLDRSGAVNLEKALRAADRLGGHIVSGHVDGVGRVLRLQPVGESWYFEVAAPRELAKYLAYKGSITVNGVSLTVNRVRDSADDCRVDINLIPHTVERTALGGLRAGDAVNLEIDLIARYVERMLSIGPTAARSTPSNHEARA